MSTSKNLLSATHLLLSQGHIYIIIIISKLLFPYSFFPLNPLTFFTKIFSKEISYHYYK